MSEKQVDWTSRDGKEWTFREMTDQHLLNTERFLRRQAEKAIDSAHAALSCGFQGEIASAMADEHADYALDAGHAMEAKAKEIQLVLKERGLTPLPL